MFYTFFHWFMKITGYPLQFVCFRTKVHYEDKRVQGRRIHGASMVISNHTSIFDYAVYIFVFYSRTLRVQVAEVLFRKKPLKWILKAIGAIYVNRFARGFGFVTKSLRILEKGGVVTVFPESRIPRPEEKRPLPFKPSAAYIALAANVPVVPVYTDGSYFTLKKRAHVIIGTPMHPQDYTDPSLSDRENVERFNTALRDKVIELEKLLNEQKQKS